MGANGAAPGMTGAGSQQGGPPTTRDAYDRVNADPRFARGGGLLGVSKPGARASYTYGLLDSLIATDPGKMLSEEDYKDIQYAARNTVPSGIPEVDKLREAIISGDREAMKKAARAIKDRREADDMDILNYYP